MSRNRSPDEVLEGHSSGSVSKKHLLGTKRHLLLRPLQRFGVVRGWLYDQPYFEYLDEGEVLRFSFRISSPVIERTGGQTHRLTPGKRYSTLIGLTDKRILIVIGQRPENDKRSISYEDVTSFSIAPHGAIKIKTRRSSAPEIRPVKVHITVETSNREIEFKPNTWYQLSGDLDGLGNYLSTRTGVRDWQHKEEWLDARRRYKAAKEEYEEWTREVKEIASRSRDPSVTARRIRQIWDFLERSEQPHFYTTGTEHRHHIIKSLERGPAESAGLYWTLFSDERVLINDEAGEWNLAYGSILDYSINEREVQLESGETEVQVQLDLQTDTDYHIIDIDNLSQQRLSDLLSFIEHQRGA